MKETKQVTYIAPEMEITTTRPVFTNPEIEQLYLQGMRIDHEVIRQILALPRQTLVEDLKKVILDGITRFNEYASEKIDDATQNFVPHAIFLLTELRASESLPTVLQIMRQGRDLFEYWFGDAAEDCLWECLYHLAGNQLSVLSDFLKEPDRYTYSRTIVGTAVAQIALHQPERREEVVEWFRGMFEFFLNEKDNEDISEGDFIGQFVNSVLDFRGKELLPEIEMIYKEDLAWEDINGDFNDVKAEMEEPLQDPLIYHHYTIYERYEHFLNTWYYYQEEMDLFPDKEPENYVSNNSYDSNKSYHEELPQTFVREEPKIGRNDPCPCGSGKKYKKCCMDS
jgi:hypothetical protein